MADYQKMYYLIVRAIDDAVGFNQQANDRLIKARLETEKLFIEAEHTPLRIVPLDLQRREDAESG